MFRKLNSKSGFTLIEMLIAIVVFTIIFLASANVMSALTDSMTSTRNSMKAVGMNKIILDQINEQLIQSDLENTAGTTHVVLFGTPVTVPGVVVGKDRTGADIVRTVSMYPGLRFYLPDPVNPVNLSTGFTNWDTRSIEYQFISGSKKVRYIDSRLASPTNVLMGENISFFGAYQVFEPTLGLFHVTVVCTTSYGDASTRPPTQRNIQNQISIRPLN